MRAESLPALIATDRVAAREHARRRHTRRVHGDHGAIRQVLVTMADGGGLADHENPGDASLLVLEGRVRLVAGDDGWEGEAGDFLVIPDRRHNLTALGEAAVLISFARARPAEVGPEGAV